ncbi:MAG TPA: YciI family protein [Longimicrobiales bacterium]
MQFMIMVKGPENAGPPPQELMAGIAKLGEEAAKAGVLVQTGGLMPSAMGARIRVARNKIAVTDGPFTEGKEVVGGYAVYELNSKEEAIEWTRRFMVLHRDLWPGWEGEAELRQIMNTGEFKP